MYSDASAKYLAVASAFALTFSTSLSALCFSLVALSWLLSGNWREKYRYISRHPAALAALALLALALIGLAYTPATSSQGLKRFDSYVNSLLFVVIFATVITDDVWRKRVFAAFLAGMAITMVLSYLAASHIISLPFGDPKRGEVFHYYITQNYFMAIAVYVAIAWYLFHRKEMSRTAGVILLSMIVLGAINVFFVTTARTGPLVLSTMILVLLIERFRVRGLLAGIVAIIALTAIVYSLSPRFRGKVHESTAQLQAVANGSLSHYPGRARFHVIGAKIVRDHPVFGVGTGGLNVAFLDYERRLQLPVFPFPDQVSLHSSYLMAATELGITGLLVLVLFIITAMREAARLPDPRRIIGLGVVVGFAVDSLVNSALTNVNEGQLFALLIGSLIGGSVARYRSTTAPVHEIE